MTMNEFVCRLYALVQAFHNKTDPDKELQRLRGTPIHPTWWRIAENLYKGWCEHKQGGSNQPPRIRLVKGGKDGTSQTS